MLIHGVIRRRVPEVQHIRIVAEDNHAGVRHRDREQSLGSTNLVAGSPKPCCPSTESIASETMHKNDASKIDVSSSIYRITLEVCSLAIGRVHIILTLLEHYRLSIRVKKIWQPNVRFENLQEIHKSAKLSET